MAGQGCVCCPYPLVVIPGILVLLAILFTFYSGFVCDFYRIQDASIDVGNTTKDLGIGLWTIQDVNADYHEQDTNNYWEDDDEWGEDEWECVGWNERNFLDGAASMIELDGSMSAARAFSLMAFLLGMIGVVLICIPCYFSFDQPRKYGKILVATYAIIGSFALLSLVALSSDICKDADSCELDTAGILAIVASIFWFTSAGLVMLALKKPRTADTSFSIGYPVEAVAAQPSAPTTEREVRTVTNEDGSTTTITRTTVTQPDGSKIVTETTETSEPPPLAESVPLGSNSVPLAAAMPAPEEMSMLTASVLSVIREPVTATKAAP